MDFTITFEEASGPADVKFLDDGISEHTKELFGEEQKGSLAFFARDADQQVVGGVLGYWSGFGWLYIDALWVHRRRRGAGIGKQLMRSIEKKAVELGCGNAYLNTMSYQAPEFYKRLGYQKFAELEDFPPGHSREFFRKRLTD